MEQETYNTLPSQFICCKFWHFYNKFHKKTSSSIMEKFMPTTSYRVTEGVSTLKI